MRHFLHAGIALCVLVGGTLGGHTANARSQGVDITLPFPDTAGASAELASIPSSHSNRLLTSKITVAQLKALLDTVEKQKEELRELRQKAESQQRVIETLTRNSPSGSANNSSSSSSTHADRQISELTQKLQEQGRALDQLRRTLEGAVKEHNRALEDLRRKIEDVARRR